MVRVVVVRPFHHLGRTVSDGECIELEPIDAAVKAYEGVVSLSHGRLYQTRDMVAGSSLHAVTVDTVVAAMLVDPRADAPPKRRRGRPRKSL